MVFKPTNPDSRHSAFTLPELLISAALGVLLLLGAITFYGFSASSFVSSVDASAGVSLVPALAT